MAKPITGYVAFGPQAGPIQLSALDTAFGALNSAVNDFQTYSNYLADTSVTPNLITVTSAVGITAAYVAGLELIVKAATTNNLGTVNINLNALGNIPVVDSDGSTIGIGAIVAGMIVPMVYDGAAFRLTGPQSTGTLGGNALFADGTVSLPSISFANSPASGIYRVGADIIGIATAGVNRINIGAAGAISIPAAVGANTLTVAGAANQFAGVFQSSAVVGQAYGLKIFGGTNGSDSAFSVSNAANTQIYLNVSGDGYTSVYEPYNSINAICYVGTYQRGTFTATMSGNTVANTSTLVWVRTGLHIVIYCSSNFYGTSNSNTCFISGVPASILPTSGIDQTCSIGVFNNGVTMPGFATIRAQINGGGIILAVNGTSTGFTSSGNKGLIGGMSFTYSLA